MRCAPFCTKASFALFEIEWVIVIQKNPLEPWNPAIQQAIKVDPSQQGSNVGGEYHAIGCPDPVVETQWFFPGFFLLLDFLGLFGKK